MTQCLNSKEIVPMVLVHGGAGPVTDDLISIKKKGTKLAARIGYETLMKTGSVVDAVQMAIEYMEDNPDFDAGRGATLNFDGEIEMDAGIMDGATLEAGCVAVVKDILHPIRLARTISSKTRHRFMAGEGAVKVAKENGFEILPPGALVTEWARKDLENYKNKVKPYDKSEGPGTVGCVAIDAKGNMAAGTSTGGTTGKLPGRIGDSPVLGAGTYADNEVGCVSTTGIGETVMRFNAASKLLNKIKYLNMTAQSATEDVLDAMNKRFGDTAGMINIDHNGNFGIYFTSKRMPWAYQRGPELHYGIEKGEDNVEIVGEPRVME